MKSLGLRKKIIIIALPIIVLGLCVFLSPANAQPMAEQANELAQIRAAIKAKGLKWTAGETSVSKMSKDQRRGLCGLKFTGKPNIDDETAAAPEGFQATPATFDWRVQGIVTDVRDQGYCGSCWAFATVAAMESQLLMDGVSAGNNLSEEAVLACDNLVNDACCGGYLDIACNHLTSNGTTDEACFPYVSGDPPLPPPCFKTFCNEICSDWEDRTQRLSGWSFVPNPLHRRFGVDNIKNSIVNNGPVVAGMIVYTDFYFYDGSGIYEPSYGVNEGGHAVLIVGYGEEGGIGYWICKNSWGTDWGEAGYFKIRYGSAYIGLDAIETYHDAPVITCNDDVGCDDGNPCTTNETCANPGATDSYCEYTNVDDGTSCGEGGICCGGECTTPACSSNEDCDDGESCTTDICANTGNCNAECVNTWPACGLEDECCGPTCDSSDPDCESCAGFKDPCTVDSDCCEGLSCVGKPGSKSCK